MNPAYFNTASSIPPLNVVYYTSSTPPPPPLTSAAPATSLYSPPPPLTSASPATQFYPPPSSPPFYYAAPAQTSLSSYVSSSSPAKEEEGVSFFQLVLLFVLFAVIGVIVWKYVLDRDLPVFFSFLPEWKTDKTTETTNTTADKAAQQQTQKTTSTNSLARINLKYRNKVSGQSLNLGMADAQRGWYDIQGKGKIDFCRRYVPSKSSVPILGCIYGDQKDTYLNDVQIGQALIDRESDQIVKDEQTLKTYPFEPIHENDLPRTIAPERFDYYGETNPSLIDTLRRGWVDLQGQGFPYDFCRNDGDANVTVKCFIATCEKNKYPSKEMNEYIFPSTSGWTESNWWKHTSFIDYDIWSNKNKTPERSYTPLSGAQVPAPLSFTC